MEGWASGEESRLGSGRTGLIRGAGGLGSRGFGGGDGEVRRRRSRFSHAGNAGLAEGNAGQCVQASAFFLGFHHPRAIYPRQNFFSTGLLVAPRFARGSGGAGLHRALRLVDVRAVDGAGGLRRGIARDDGADQGVGRG